MSQHPTNYLIRSLGFDQQIRIIFIENTNLAQERCNDLPVAPLIKKALAQTLSIAGLVSGTLKDTQRISLRVLADDRRYQILAEADAEGNVRGFISQPMLEISPNQISKMTLPEFFGNKGVIQVIKDLGRYGKMFTGVTKMLFGNIVDDFSYYFEQSEQVPSEFMLQVEFDANGQITLSRGLFAQLLPGASKQLMDEIKQLSEASSLWTPTTAMYTAVQQLPQIEILSVNPVQFHCNCSQDMLRQVVSQLTPAELQEYLNRHENIEIVCNMCGTKYYFDPKTFI